MLLHNKYVVAKTASEYALVYSQTSHKGQLSGKLGVHLYYPSSLQTILGASAHLMKAKTIFCLACSKGIGSRAEALRSALVDHVLHFISYKIWGKMKCLWLVEEIGGAGTGSKRLTQQNKSPKFDVWGAY